MADRPGWSQRLAVVATSFRRVGFGRLGRFVIPPEEREAREALRRALGAEQLVYLATCNRVECYLLLPEASAGREAELQAAAQAFFAARGAQLDPETFLAHTGRAALQHLFAVVSSLDSLAVGETEISGQARRALDKALAEGLCGRTFRHLFERAVSCSRRVRGATAVGSTHVSCATIALQKIRKHFGKAGPGVTVLVGVGDMSRKVAQALQDCPGKLIVVNRTRSRAEDFCARYGGTPCSLEEFKRNPPGWVDLVFTATSAEETVIAAADLELALRARREAEIPAPLIICDLGLPRDVDPALESTPGVLLVAMEHIEMLSQMKQRHLDEAVEAAREIVDDEVARLLREDRFRVMAGESTRAMIDRRLAHLAEADRRAILSFVNGLAGRFARQPLDSAG